MKTLLLVTAGIELAAGTGLLAAPSTACVALFAAPLDAPAALAAARVGGAGLTSLGLACFLARDADSAGPAARGLVGGMLFYNVAAVVVLAAAGLFQNLAGPALWPAVLLHVGMSAWCLAALRMR